MRTATTHRRPGTSAPARTHPAPHVARCSQACSGLAAVIFALQHFQYGWIGILMVLVYGVVLGLLRVASGGLFLPIMAHMFINLISLAV